MLLYVTLLYFTLLYALTEIEASGPSINQEHNDKGMPIYTKVDKSKKKRKPNNQENKIDASVCNVDNWES